MGVPGFTGCHHDRCTAWTEGTVQGVQAFPGDQKQSEVPAAPAFEVVAALLVDEAVPDAVQVVTAVPPTQSWCKLR